MPSKPSKDTQTKQKSPQNAPNWWQDYSHWLIIMAVVGLFFLTLLVFSKQTDDDALTNVSTATLLAEEETDEEIIKLSEFYGKAEIEIDKYNTVYDIYNKYLEANNYEQAIATLYFGISELDEDALLSELIGKAYERQGDIENAILAYEQAAQLYEQRDNQYKADTLRYRNESVLSNKPELQEIDVDAQCCDGVNPENAVPRWGEDRPGL